MDETKALEVVQLGTLAVAPEDVIERATVIAKSLAAVIKDRQLYHMIQGKAYVQIEGWTTLGAILGVLPREIEVKELPDGAYEARVELLRTNDGAVIGRASSICGMDEPRWADKPKYARRSMAVTRATGKAYRLGFAWIMKLAGYEPTPAEEMDVVEGEARPVGTPARATLPWPKMNGERPYPPAVLKERIEARVLQHNQLSRGKFISPAEHGLMVRMLEACFGPEKDKTERRYAVTKYLFGVELCKGLSHSQGLAMLDCLKPFQDNGGAYQPDPMAVREILGVYADVVKMNRTPDEKAT